MFCGYALDDAHIAQILYSLEAGARDRPPYMAVSPSFDEYDKAYWSNYKMTAMRGTFEEFLKTIEAKIPSNKRVLGSLLTGAAGSLSRWLQVGQAIGNTLQAILSSRLLHIHRTMPLENPAPLRFYRGDSTSWSAISNDLDFSRSVSNQILNAVDFGIASGTRFVLVKGHAGSGKSVVLKRVAWELCGPGSDALTFFNDKTLGGVKEVLDELCKATNQRVFILIDDALFDPANLNECLLHAKKRGLPITFIAAARGNEWNVSQHSAHLIPDEEYTVGDLSTAEALALVRLLKKHNCLGALEKLKTETEQVASLLGENERQLLVSLHIATLGENDFRKLLRSEYRNISPPEAQILYLDICSLHRLQIAVRAGLISRMSGTSFHAFQERFFSPLEKVVSVFSDPMSKDFAYRARHAEIARIVFEEALPTPEDRANQMARVLSSLNTDYSSDDRAASLLLKGRLLADEYSDRALVERIFQAAEQTGIDRAFVLQQRAIFEINHPGGSGVRALRLIDEALSVTSRSPGAIHHTKAVVLRALANQADVDPSVADRYREQGLAELRDHGQLRNSRYGITTYCEILLDQVKTRLNDAEVTSTQPLSQEAMVRKLSDLENYLNEGMQRFPDDTHVATLRAELFNALDKNPRAIAILRTAFAKTPSNVPLALRFSKQLIDSGDQASTDEALAVLRCAVGLNAASKPLNYQLARLLMNIDEPEHRAEISKLLRRSFTPGDTHFEAQFWCARHEFLFGDRAVAHEIYDRFSKRPVPYVDIDEKRGLVKDSSGKATEYSGTLRRLKGDFGFVQCPALNESIFLYRTQLKNSTWIDARIGDSLQFKVAFSFRGPCCVDALPV